MYNEETIVEKNLTLSFEFERYLLENPEMLAHIPSGAEVVLLPKDDPELYKINLESAQKSEVASDNELVFIEIEGLRPPRSRLVNPHLTLEPTLG